MLVRRSLVLAVLGGLLMADSTLLLAQQPLVVPVAVGPQVVLHAKFCQGDRQHADRAKILASPTVVTIPGRPVAMHSGGLEQAQDPLGRPLAVEIGVRLEGVLGAIEENRAPLSLSISHGERVDDHPGSLTVVTHAARLLRTVELGMTEIVSLEGAGTPHETWVELRVQWATDATAAIKSPDGPRTRGANHEHRDLTFVR